MDYSNYDNNLLIREMQQEIKELTETIARLRKIATAAYAKIDKLEETIQQEFPRETPTAIDLNQFLTSMDEEQPEETIHSDPILTKTNCNITKAFQANALDNMDYGQF